MKKRMDYLTYVTAGIALFALAVSVLGYIDSHRVAEHTLNENLRPVLLRSGWIADWKLQSVEDANTTSKPQFIEFTNQKNIAKDITGYIIIERRKYTLLFGNEISQEIITNQDATVTKMGVAPKWGWLPAGGKVYATFQKQNYEESTEPNQIYLEYEDIEDNSYFTKEDDKYSQTSGRI